MTRVALWPSWLLEELQNAITNVSNNVWSFLTLVPWYYQILIHNACTYNILRVP
jgi:hypothetical protein